LASFLTRLPASESKATWPPSPSTDGLDESSFPSLPPLDTLTRSVTPVAASWTKMSAEPFASFATSVLAMESNAVTLPSPLMAGRVKRPLMSSPCVPSVATLTRTVVPEPGAALAPTGIVRAPSATIAAQQSTWNRTASREVIAGSFRIQSWS
jgi:hypothetical protein